MTVIDISTTDRSCISYAQVVRAGCLTSRDDDEWSDIASMTDCSWPSDESDAGDIEISESTSISHGPVSGQCDPHNVGIVDGRTERVIHHSAKHLARAKRLYCEVPVCGSDKPWRQVPGYCSRTCRLERQTLAKKTRKRMRSGLKKVVREYEV